VRVTRIAAGFLDGLRQSLALTPTLSLRERGTFWDRFLSWTEGKRQLSVRVLRLKQGVEYNVAGSLQLDFGKDMDVGGHPHTVFGVDRVSL